MRSILFAAALLLISSQFTFGATIAPISVSSSIDTFTSQSGAPIRVIHHLPSNHPFAQQLGWSIEQPQIPSFQVPIIQQQPQQTVWQQSPQHQLQPSLQVPHTRVEHPFATRLPTLLREHHPKLAIDQQPEVKPQQQPIRIPLTRIQRPVMKTIEKPTIKTELPVAGTEMKEEEEQQPLEEGSLPAEKVVPVMKPKLEVPIVKEEMKKEEGMKEEELQKEAEEEEVALRKEEVAVPKSEKKTEKKIDVDVINEEPLKAKEEEEKEIVEKESKVEMKIPIVEEKPIVKQKEQVEEKVEEKFNLPIFPTKSEQKESKKVAEERLNLPTIPTTVEKSSPLSCPAIQFKHDFQCAAGQCLVSFINLTPSIALDWVDIHLSSSAPAMLTAVGIDSSSIGHNNNNLASMNHRMKLAAGPLGAHHLRLGESTVSEADKIVLPNLGQSSLASTLLSASPSVGQVWQFAVPLTYTHGGDLKARWTYCAEGTDCDTEMVSLIETEKPKVKLGVSTSSLTCPAITHSQSLHCSSGECLISFLNLSPQIALDWVDIHVKAQSNMKIAATGTNGVNEATSTSATHFNYRMKLAAGPLGTHHLRLGESTASEADKIVLPSIGSSSLASNLLQQTSAQQVWQFPLPLSIAENNQIQVAFTYCALGTDCDTEFTTLTMNQN